MLGQKYTAVLDARDRCSLLKEAINSTTSLGFDGIALAFQLPRGQHFFIGVDRVGDLPRTAVERSRLAADLQLFAAHALEPAQDVHFLRSGQELLELTPRERECLAWTSEGKTAWELGRIFGISEQTAVRHLNDATHKLDCVSKHSAVAKASRRGLIC